MSYSGAAHGPLRERSVSAGARSSRLLARLGTAQLSDVATRPAMPALKGWARMPQDGRLDIKVRQFAIYVMDFGGPVGFRLALWHPERLTAVIAQNAPLYPEEPRGWWAMLGRYLLYDIRSNGRTFAACRSSSASGGHRRLWRPEATTRSFRKRLSALSCAATRLPSITHSIPVTSRSKTGQTKSQPLCAISCPGHCSPRDYCRLAAGLGRLHFAAQDLAGRALRQ
jgi:pimeloyl-ACP methyl ester carboxylesterase